MTVYPVIGKVSGVASKTLKEWRERHGWTQQVLAAKSGVSQQRISDIESTIERGDIPNPTMGVVWALEKAVGGPVRWVPKRAKTAAA